MITLAVIFGCLLFGIFAGGIIYDLSEEDYYDDGSDS